MGWIARLLGLERSRPLAGAYIALVDGARVPQLFLRLGVADDVDGRFDMIALVLGLALDRLDQLGDEGQAYAVALSERFVDDMDRSVRELGVGDLSVGKHVKHMASALEGRRHAYGSALAAADEEALQAALVRNLYRGTAPSSDMIAAACAVATGWHGALARMDAAAIASLAEPPALAAFLP